MSSSTPFHLDPVEARLFKTPNDPNDPRLGDLVKVSPAADSMSGIHEKLKSIATQPGSFVVIGYPDDDGISLNGGRVGAKEAPDRIRSFFYRMTPPGFPTQAPSAAPLIHDFGNLRIKTDSAPDTREIALRHNHARSLATFAQDLKIRMLSFGGGHDYGFPDAAAYCAASLRRGERPLVINFDAHLDVRPLHRGITSGTPFFRLLEEFPDIEFIELGLQSQCNSKAHVDWLIARGGQVSFEEDRLATGKSLTDTLAKLLGDHALSRRTAFLSVDIDAFSSAVAPGASQSWPTGFEPADFFSCFSWCLGRFDIRGLGVYEVSPKLDVDDRTSRLAALIAHRFVFQL